MSDETLGILVWIIGAAVLVALFAPLVCRGRQDRRRERGAIRQGRDTKSSFYHWNSWR